VLLPVIYLFVENQTLGRSHGLSNVCARAVGRLQKRPQRLQLLQRER
jgi:hypothetical protein